MSKKKLDIRVDSVDHFFKDLLKLTFFGEGVIEATHEPGDSKLVLVTGENATGKSFVRRIIGAALHEHTIESIALSMQFRTSYGDIRKAFIYGDESNNSTGSLSAHTVTTAINTSRGRDKKHVIVWDEPDVGLSDNYAAGAAEEILEFTNDPPEHLLFAVVTTHRRAMLERLAEGKPHHLRLGDKKTLEQVVKAKVVPTKLSKLADKNITMFRRIYKEFGL